MHNTGHWLDWMYMMWVPTSQMVHHVYSRRNGLTVEPGLYFGAWRPDVDCPERYANIGIRIEDDVLVTNGDPDVLTNSCPKTIDDIERIVGSFEVAVWLGKIRCEGFYPRMKRFG